MFDPRTQTSPSISTASALVPRLHLLCDPRIATQAPSALVPILREARSYRTPLAVHLRAKGLDGASLLRAAHDYRQTTADHAVSFVVNGRLDIARLADADGLHLPGLGVDGAAADRVWKRNRAKRRFRGRSCHGGQALAAAEQEQADYAFLSPLAAVPGKNPPLGVGKLSALAAAVAIPVIALGGVRSQDVSLLLREGIYGIALCRGVFAADDPVAVVRACLESFAAESL